MKIQYIIQYTEVKTILSRLIKEELSKRKSISGRGETADEPAKDEIMTENSREEINDDLMQKKHVLLKVSNYYSVA